MNIIYKIENMKYAIITTSGLHEYDIEVVKTKESTTYLMTYSQSDMWTYPGDTLHVVIDDGNSINFNAKLKRTMDYTTLIELSILFDFIKNNDERLTEQYNVYQLIK